MDPPIPLDSPLVIHEGVSKVGAVFGRLASEEKNQTLELVKESLLSFCHDTQKLIPAQSQSDIQKDSRKPLVLVCLLAQEFNLNREHLITFLRQLSTLNCYPVEFGLGIRARISFCML